MILFEYFYIQFKLHSQEERSSKNDVSFIPYWQIQPSILNFSYFNVSPRTSNQFLAARKS